ncbi:radical SAM family heme chaperone HemW [Vagococcus lutrae]|uniref:radical SAM family heme chaperone HemW n=1 Tax=Vagococcus lutrae TaxID=81947 RepID=UPI00288CE293|nr:radical SAM family heme chaperone HemW [Vagococcus lutrae]MDT2800880.1 radical SAM family heme chaperone HemW [Vagococcus lutrae]MDT2826726.1 radical SAM family heme chaperone HemW [Vagococcus lutrae]MDT2842372.1 radical SAM family heme chaperone HemW [Vagococcus lutrae]
MIKSAYLHIPFCEHICYYCDFNKVFIEGQPVDEYIDMLIREMSFLKEEVSAHPLSTMYIGGGTPTSLSAKQLEKLMIGIHEQLPLASGVEFTVEANPGDLTADKIAVLKNYGVNRLSMGVQSFDDRLLKKIGRKHTASDVFDTMRLLEKSGLNNVSIDLIYALPGQSLESFQDSLDKALSLDLPHYSLYSLILENQTVFYNLARQGSLHLPDEDEEGDMFDLAASFMEAHGRKQYEVSNFAIPGKESQHNLVYWNNEEYYGLGAGASGYLDGVRYRNFGPIQQYMQPLKEQKRPIRDEEILTEQARMEEELFLGLRKREGVSYALFYEKFNQSLDEVFGNVIEELVAEKLLVKDTQHIALTRRGLALGNNVFQRFLLDK